MICTPYSVHLTLSSRTLSLLSYSISVLSTVYYVHQSQCLPLSIPKIYHPSAIEKSSPTSLCAFQDWSCIILEGLLAEVSDRTMSRLRSMSALYIPFNSLKYLKQIFRILYLRASCIRQSLFSSPIPSLSFFSKVPRSFLPLKWMPIVSASCSGHFCLLKAVVTFSRR